MRACATLQKSMVMCLQWWFDTLHTMCLSSLLIFHLVIGLTHSEALLLKSNVSNLLCFLAQICNFGQALCLVAELTVSDPTDFFAEEATCANSGHCLQTTKPLDVSSCQVTRQSSTPVCSSSCCPWHAGTQFTSTRFFLTKRTLLMRHMCMLHNASTGTYSDCCYLDSS